MRADPFNVQVFIAVSLAETLTPPGIEQKREVPPKSVEDPFDDLPQHCEQHHPHARPQLQLFLRQHVPAERHDGFERQHDRQRRQLQRGQSVARHELSTASTKRAATTCSTSSRNYGGASENLTYNYPAGANNGKVSSMYNAVSGETVTYTYDSLNRLLTAERQRMGRAIWLRSLRQPDHQAGHRRIGRRACRCP